MSLPPLATEDDVATALGVADPSLLPPTMQIRMDPTLAKVSRRFRLEAQRIFTPGTYTHTLRINAGAVRLMEVPTQILGVRIEGLPQYDWGTVDAEVDPSDGGEPDYNVGSPPPGEGLQWLVEKQWLRWQDWGYWRLNGRQVEVEYRWDTPVPADVTATVADIVGRNLTVDPMSAVRQSKVLASRHFRQELADWVISGDVGFSKDDIAQARSYRYPAPPTIIAALGGSDYTLAGPFFSDSSW